MTLDTEVDKEQQSILPPRGGQRPTTLVGLLGLKTSHHPQDLVEKQQTQDQRLRVLLLPGSGTETTDMRAAETFPSILSTSHLGTHGQILGVHTDSQLTAEAQATTSPTLITTHTTTRHLESHTMLDIVATTRAGTHLLDRAVDLVRK